MKAWQWLERCGWDTWTNCWDHGERLSLIQAIYKATGNYPDYDAAVLKIQAKLGLERSGVYSWQDDPTRTQADVVALLKELDI